MVDIPGSTTRTIQLGEVEYVLTHNAPFPTVYHPDTMTECRIAGGTHYLSFGTTSQDSNNPIEIAVNFRLRLSIDMADRIADAIKKRVALARAENAATFGAPN